MGDGSNPMGPPFTVAKARYAKAMMVIQCASKADGSGFKTRAHRLAEYFGRRYTNREKGYLMSRRAVGRFKEAYAEGQDVNLVTGKLDGKKINPGPERERLGLLSDREIEEWHRSIDKARRAKNDPPVSDLFERIFGSVAMTINEEKTLSQRPIEPEMQLLWDRLDTVMTSLDFLVASIVGSKRGITLMVHPEKPGYATCSITNLKTNVEAVRQWIAAHDEAAAASQSDASPEQQR